MNIPFFKPEINESTISSVVKVLKSGWLTSGPKTSEFEEKFAAYTGVKHAVFLNSGTAALHLSLAAIGLKEGDEVITTPFTFAATAEVIEYFKAKPVFCDIRTDTLNIDEGLIESKVNSRTKAIIPVHFAGHPCEMDVIMEIAGKHQLYVIEDAAHCLPAEYRGRSIGTIGHMTCFSFYANKCITTGEGGMLTTEDTALADKVRILRLHGLSRDAINRYEQSGSWKYDIVSMGYKYNPTDLAAAIGIGQLEQANEFYNERRRVVDTYISHLDSFPEIELPKELNYVRSSLHLFPVRLCGKYRLRRDEVIQQLNRMGIGTSVHFIPLHLHSYYSNKYGYRPEDFPIANENYERIISLPVYPALTQDSIKYISQSLKDLLT